MVINAQSPVSGNDPVSQAALSPRPMAKRTPRQQFRRDGLVRHLVEPALVTETAELLHRQTVDICDAFKPRNGWQEWLAGTIATIMIRINRCERIERKLRDLASYRAIDFWEDDQQLAVETLAVRLYREPAKVVAKFRMTPAGVDWLAARWQILARLAPEAWTDAHRELATHLLGGAPGGDASAAGFAAAQLAELADRRERIAEADAIARGLVEADLDDDAVPGLARLRRHVRALQKQMKWYVDQFHVEHADRWDDPRRRPACEHATEPARAFNHDMFEGPPAWVVAAREERAAAAAMGESPAVDRTPESSETKPTFEPANIELNEMKPTPAVPTSQTDETKPTATAQPRPFAPLVPPVPVHDYSNETGRNHNRSLRAGEPSREYARRQKAARRRTNLSLLELT